MNRRVNRGVSLHLQATCRARSSQLVILVCLMATSLASGQNPGQESVQSLAARAERLEEQDKWEEAAAAYRQILKIDARSIPALNRLGALSVRQEKYREGLKYYGEALKLNPYEFGTNLNMGIACIKMQDFRAAIAPLERAVKADPSHFQARELLGVALVAQDDYARAIPHLEKAAALSPQDHGTLYLLNRSYLK